MSAKPKPDASDNLEDAPKRKPMPFEPKKSVEKVKQPRKEMSKEMVAPVKHKSNNRNLSAQGIPDAVSRRMVQRVALFCGIPTALGMSTFVLSYLAVSRSWLALPPYAVLLVSLGWFGLGVLGVSYGVLSASWDEDSGSPLGFAEFRTNWARLTETWRSQNQQNKKSTSSSRSSK